MEPNELKIDYALNKEMMAYLLAKESRSYSTCKNYMKANFSLTMAMHPFQVLSNNIPLTPVEIKRCVTHPLEVITNSDFVIRIRNKEELHAIWYMLCTSGFQTKYPEKAKSLYKVLHFYVKKFIPEVLDKWHKLAWI